METPPLSVGRNGNNPSKTVDLRILTLLICRMMHVLTRKRFRDDYFTPTGSESYNNNVTRTTFSIGKWDKRVQPIKSNNHCH